MRLYLVLSLFTCLFSLLSAGRASPIARRARGGSLALARASTESNAPTVPVTQADANSTLLRPAQFAQLAYCSADTLPVGADLSKGIPGAAVVQVGGNDGTIPLYYIATDSATSSIVVAHQGTDEDSFASILNDIQLGLVPLNSTRFTNASDVMVHEGFQKTFERTADDILAGVRTSLTATGWNKVALAGHSLGAAIAVMDAVYLKQQLPSTTELSTVVFGLPRGGDQAWADFVDSQFEPTQTTFAHITNKADPVPLLPFITLGFIQPQGEIHIVQSDEEGDPTQIVSCPGQENKNCSAGLSILDVVENDHFGPYFANISMSHDACPL